MKIDITVVRENEDGSVNVEVELCEKGKNYLLETGLETLIMKTIDYAVDTHVTEQEEEAWEQAQQSHDIHTRNRASMNAWKEAGMYVTENADKLGRLTLRQAFEEGYRRGYMAGVRDG